jgi:hypothetical protein
MNKIKKFVNKDAIKKTTVYYALVQSSITYCMNVYGSANKTTLTPLFLKEKKAIRIIAKANYRDHSGSFLQIWKYYSWKN